MLRNFLIFAYVAVLVAFVVSQMTLQRGISSSTPSINIGGKDNSSSGGRKKYCNIRKPSRTMYQCCKSMPVMFVDQFKKECASTCEYPGIICCTYNCAWKKAGVLTNGAIDGTLFTNKLKAMTNGTKWDQIITTTVQSCINSGEEIFLKNLS